MQTPNPELSVRGDTRLTEPQRKTLNAACGDLADQIVWHGNRLTKDDWRHFFSGTVKGWRTMPGYDMGDGRPGLIMLGGSSMDLSKSQASDALTMAFCLGDDPESQGLKGQKAVRWCNAVCCARWITNEDY